MTESQAFLPNNSVWPHKTLFWKNGQKFPQTLLNLLESLPGRVEAVIVAKCGWHHVTQGHIHVKAGKRLLVLRSCQYYHGATKSHKLHSCVAQNEGWGWAWALSKGYPKWVARRCIFNKFATPNVKCPCLCVFQQLSRCWVLLWSHCKMASSLDFEHLCQSLHPGS